MKKRATNQLEMPQAKSDSKGVLFNLALLTVFFALIEISFFIECNRAYISDFTFVSNQLSIPLAIVPGVLFFVAAQFFLHIVFYLATVLLSLGLIRAVKLKNDQALYVAFAVWFFAIFTLFLTNQYLYPNSKFADLTAQFFSHQLARHLLFGMAVAWCLLLCVALVGWCRMMAAKTLIGLGVVAGFSGIFYLYVQLSNPTVMVDGSTAAQPNIILIGMDSLRPNFLGFYGSNVKTPTLDHLLSRSVAFSDAVTPLARTFPSWTSILTGQYPKEVGVRSNLASQAHLALSHSLPSVLRQHGYETIYATDETRFSNIGKNYGFNQMVTPPIGLNDFLLGTFNDFPLSNLIINTRLGKWLFPYSYGNRPAFITYDPASFVELVSDALPNKRHRPLFLATHFCLTHSPYVWSDFMASQLNAKERYKKSIERVDRQVQHFLLMLEYKKILQNAIVVLLSDHGEALELPYDRITGRDAYVERQPIKRFYPPSLDNEDVNKSAGHGTDVLGLPQYHVLLAFTRFGKHSFATKTIPELVSLLDIKPTLLNLVNVNAVDSSGHSLLHYLDDANSNITHQKENYLFLESDFSPAAIRTVYPNTRDVLLQGLQLFQIDPVTTRLTVKPSMSQMIIGSKQYAEIYKHWMIASYPVEKSKRTIVLVNLETGQWTDNLSSSLALRSPVKVMLKRLKMFYGQELNASS